MPAGPVSNWQLAQSPVTGNFNGISAASPNFAIAVGDGGQIVHFIDNDAGAVLPSGTTANLLDVFVVAPDRALASGQDVVLQWNGSTWSTVIQDDFQVSYAPVWHPPERDRFFYGVLESGAVCPATFDNGRDGFCRNFPARALNFCGRSDDFKLILANGDIWHLDNSLNNPVDPLSTEPLFDQEESLSLTAVFVPPGACFDGPSAPAQLFGIDQGREFWRFDGTGWASMGSMVPTNQSLNWLSGSGPDNLVAGGARTSAAKGPSITEGVVWRYDGMVWAEDQMLPPGTPGISDVDVSYQFQQAIFNDSFESIVGAKLSVVAGETVATRLAADGGVTLTNANLRPSRVADLGVRIAFTVLPEGADVLFTNFGPDAANAEYSTLIGILSSSNCPNATISSVAGDSSGEQLRGSLTLQSGETVLCQIATASLLNSLKITPTNATDPNLSNNAVNMQTEGR